MCFVDLLLGGKLTSFSLFPVMSWIVFNGRCRAKFVAKRSTHDLGLGFSKSLLGLLELLELPLLDVLPFLSLLALASIESVMDDNER
jgi:hypothetical protein